MRKLKVKYQNRLPHIAPIGAIFFVTFRLKGSLPQQVVRDIREQLEFEVNSLNKKEEGFELKLQAIKKSYFSRYDHLLDNAKKGNCFLQKPEVAAVVKAKIHELDGKYYELMAYTIMPNHVHLLFDTSIQLVDDKNIYLKELSKDYVQLHKIMRLIKGSTAYLANQVLARKGAFWQKDSFDRYIRNEEEFYKTLQYILDNPVHAGLIKKWKDFPHSYVKSGLLE